MSKPKYKVGDKLRCIRGVKVHESDAPGGAGWREGAEFIVKSITDYSSNPNVYWQDENQTPRDLTSGCGVYEDWLELIDEPHTSKPSGLGKLKAKMGRWYVPL